MQKSLLSLSWLLAALSVSADPVISEFMASNSTALADEDGDFSDWIEIYNPDATAVNLAGWYLTDDKDDPTQWVFPAQSLPAGGRLVVFASNKNRAVAGSELHSNFKLSAGGEYLALIKPDGTTTATEFDEFPPQITDYSYGLQQAASSTFTPIEVASSYRYTVPQSTISGWNGAGFDDSSWTAASGGIGYERSSGYDPYITTDIESQVFGQASSVYLRYDFNVADASAITALQLQTKHDDGFVAYLNGQPVASDNAPASVFWFSQSNFSQEAVLGSFSNFNINSEIEHLVDGNNVLAIQLLNQNQFSSDSLLQTQLQLTSSTPINSTEYAYFATATPNAINNTQPFTPSGDVAISVGSGVKSGPISVTLTAAEPTAQIYYTLDGTTPSESSTLYTGALSISDPSRLRARAYEPGKSGGKVAVADYSFLDASLLGYLADVPVIVMDNFGAGSFPAKTVAADGNGVVQVERQSNVMSFFDQATNSQPFSAAPSLETRAGCRVRGSSSSGFPRKPLSVEFWEDSEEDDDRNSASPFGMAPEADWALYAPYDRFDRILVHNKVSFELAKLLGMAAPNSKVVVVFQNTDGGKVGLSDLAGVYILMEKVERNRIGADFSKMNEAGTEGGWMISVDRLGSIPVGMPSSTIQPNFHCAGPNGVLEVPDDVDGASNTQPQPDDISTFYHSFLNFEEPGGFDILSAQRSAIQTKVRAMDSVLWSPGMGDETTGYPAHIDVESWVKYYMVHNFARNQDSIVLSTFLYSESPTDKVRMGPVWDFDRAYTSRGSATVFPYWNGDRDWYRALLNDTNFLQEYQDVWQEARRTTLSDAALEELVDSAVAGLRSDQIVASGVNYSTWLTRVADTKTWMLARAAYFDSRFEALPNYAPTNREFVGSASVTMSPVSGGVVYYTLDGTDPRAWGGGIAGSAQLYTGAINLTSRTRVTMRAYDGGSWSGKIVQDYYQTSELPELVVSKFDYHPADASSAEEALGFTNKDDFEYIEILNVGSSVADLSTLEFSDGVYFDFSTGAFTQLLPGERAIVVANMAAYKQRYGVLTPVVGQYSGNLRNSSENITLKDALLDLNFQSFTYDDESPWPLAADGSGHTLVLKNPTTKPDHSVGSNWRASRFVGGEPGDPEAVAALSVSPTSDVDKDGVSALVEHFLGTSDSNAAQGLRFGSVASFANEEDGENYPTFSIQYQMGADDVTGSAEWSSNLSGWDGTSASILLLSDTPNGDGTGTRVWRSTQPYSADMPQFFRLKVEQ